MITQTIAISLSELMFLGIDDPDYIDVHVAASEILPEVIALVLCSGELDDFYLEELVYRELGSHGFDSDNEDLYAKVTQYVKRCVKSCRQYVPDNGICKFESAYTTDNLQIILIVKYSPHEVLQPCPGASDVLVKP